MKTYESVLKALRLKQGFQQRDVTRLLNEMGIETANTQVSRWEHGYNNPNLEQFIGLCKIYSVKDVNTVFSEGNLSGQAVGLNREGLNKLEDYRQLLIDSGRYSPAEPVPERKVLKFSSRQLPVYDLRISAGLGQFAENGDASYEMEYVPEDVPQTATFGLIVSGDSMEPAIQNGEKIWVHRQQTLENGNIGVFYLDGSLLVKEYCVTDDGVFLVSRNKKYPPRPITEYSDAVIYGKVIYPFWRG
ncbi:MAG: helix-turn-helix domain-containing protein [Clostridiales bacterium]|nr:helix-turn-helix domain-containing protein [Clostridiales bacterium]